MAARAFCRARLFVVSEGEPSHDDHRFELQTGELPAASRRSRPWPHMDASPGKQPGRRAPNRQWPNAVHCGRGLPCPLHQGGKRGGDYRPGCVVERAGQPGQGQSSQLAQSTSSLQSCDGRAWHAQKDGVDVWSHHEATSMQNRFGEGSPPMFNLSSYTVAIAGRPVQATPDGRLVMSHRPCAGDQNSIKLVACSCFFLVALAASDV